MYIAIAGNIGAGKTTLTNMLVRASQLPQTKKNERFSISILIFLSGYIIHVTGKFL